MAVRKKPGSLTPCPSSSRRYLVLLGCVATLGVLRLCVSRTGTEPIGLPGRSLRTLGTLGTLGASEHAGAGAAAGANVGEVVGVGFKEMRCHRRTVAGLCVGEVFKWADEAYREQWPGGVDLLIRSYISEKFFLLNLLFHSIELMWPKGIGDVILVLDEGDSMVLDMVPQWVKVFYEPNYLEIPGKILQQWSYGWADNYTTAPFVAIIDDDVVLDLKVTPPLLFNTSTGKPYIIASRQTQMDNWLPSTHFLVGEDGYFANFMVQLPFVVPREVFRRFREHVGGLHPEHGGTYDSALRWFAFNGPDVKRTQIQHTALGNFMYKHMHQVAEWVPEWSDHMPIPRVGVHLPYALAFRVATNHIDGIPRVTSLYVELAGRYAHEGVCHSFPRGSLPGCEEVLKFQQKQIWMYALDWYDWPLLFKKRWANATQIYDRHIEELHCMYAVMKPLELSNGAVMRTSGSSLVEKLKRECLGRVLPLKPYQE